MIRAVIYDLDDTLYDFKTPNVHAQQNLCKEAERRLGVPAEEFEQVFIESYHAVADRTPQDLRDQLQAGERDLYAMHSRSLRLNYTLEKLRKPLLPYAVDLYNCYWEDLLANIKPEPHLTETLDWLKAKGIRIGIGSNMMARIQYRKLINLGLADYIDFAVTSDETAFDKPDPRFFRMVLDKAGYPAEECLFIGDNRKRDYEGAKASGLHALWYQPERLAAGEEIAPELQVLRDHAELPAILERMGI